MFLLGLGENSVADSIQSKLFSPPPLTEGKPHTWMTRSLLSITCLHDDGGIDGRKGLSPSPRFPGENNKAGFRSSSFGGIPSLVTGCVGCWADRIAHDDTSVSAVPASGRKDSYYEGENRSGPNRRFCLQAHCAFYRKNYLRPKVIGGGYSTPGACSLLNYIPHKKNRYRAR